MCFLMLNTICSYRYGIHGGSTSAKAALYARKEEELSIKVQYSSKPCEDNRYQLLWWSTEHYNNIQTGSAG